MALRKAVDTTEVAEEKVVNEELALKRLSNATLVAKSVFNLGDDYVVTKFNDKGSKVDLTLDNAEFTIAITIKDTEMYAID